LKQDQNDELKFLMENEIRSGFFIGEMNVDMYAAASS
jgi:hypothetical protein